MREADLEAVMAIESRAYEFPWTETIMADCLRVGYSCWVMEQQGELSGYGVMSVAVGECHILNLCVSPEQRGHGLGSRLLTTLLEHAVEHHAKIAFLEVRPSNRAAVALYSSAGFNEIGLRSNYYPANGGREDALIMALHLVNEEDCC